MLRLGDYPRTDLLPHLPQILPLGTSSRPALAEIQNHAICPRSWCSCAGYTLALPTLPFLPGIVSLFVLLARCQLLLRVRQPAWRFHELTSRTWAQSPDSRRRLLQIYPPGYESITGWQELPPLRYLDITVLATPPVFRLGSRWIYP